MRPSELSTTVAIEAAEFAASVIRARQDGRVSMLMGHDVYESTCEAQRHISPRASGARAGSRAGRRRRRRSQPDEGHRR